MDDWKLISRDDMFVWALALPNGWSALVSDWSQAKSPPSTTPEYRIAASCRNRIVQCAENPKCFEDAKLAARSFALSQEPTCCHGWDERAQRCHDCAVLATDGRT